MSEEEESHLEQQDSSSGTDDEDEEWPMSTLQRQVSETCRHLNHQHLTNVLQVCLNVFHFTTVHSLLSLFVISLLPTKSALNNRYRKHVN